jgi:hypothetical protein
VIEQNHVFKKYDPDSREKRSTQGRNKKKLENKVKILNPTPSNMDMGVLMTEYVQMKQHLLGKSQ